MYPSGAEIAEYWKKVARKYRLYEVAKFEYEVKQANWEAEGGNWRFRIQGLKSGEMIEDEAEFFFNCMGQSNNWKWPDIPDREEFEGKMMHSAMWDETYDFNGQTVALIGSGSTAVQILPKIRPLAQHLDAYIRNQMWVSPRFGADYILARNPELEERKFVLTDELRRRFIEDSQFYNEYRKGLETSFNSIHGFTLNNHPIQNMFREFMSHDMEAKLAKKPEIYSKLIPTFPAGCRRVTPGVGFLEALVEDNVTFRSQEIKRFTEQGLQTVDGESHDYDAIICATGYDCSFCPRFPVTGINGVDLRDAFNETPSTYFSVAVDAFPNMFLIGGPNSEVGTSHSMIVFEKVGDYAVKCVQKAQFEHIKAMAPTRRAVSDFMTFVTTYFTNNRTVYGERCRTVYRNGKTEGPSTALWPGSVLHFIRTLQEPRWQDYEYEYLNTECMFGYLGDGWTDAEKNGGDVAYYLDEVEFPPIPLEDG